MTDQKRSDGPGRVIPNTPPSAEAWTVFLHDLHHAVPIARSSAATTGVSDRLRDQHSMMQAVVAVLELVQREPHLAGLSEPLNQLSILLEELTQGRQADMLKTENIAQNRPPQGMGRDFLQAYAAAAAENPIAAGRTRTEAGDTVARAVGESMGKTILG